MFKVGDLVRVNHGAFYYKLGKVAGLPASKNSLSIIVDIDGFGYVYFKETELELITQAQKTDAAIDKLGQCIAELKALIDQVEQRNELETLAVLRYIVAKVGKNV